MARYKLPFSVFQSFSIEGEGGAIYLRPGRSVTLTDKQFAHVKKIEPLCAQLSMKLPEPPKPAPVKNPAPVEVVVNGTGELKANLQEALGKDVERVKRFVQDKSKGK